MSEGFRSPWREVKIRSGRPPGAREFHRPAGDRDGAFFVAVTYRGQAGIVLEVRGCLTLEDPFRPGFKLPHRRPTLEEVIEARRWLVPKEATMALLLPFGSIASEDPAMLIMQEIHPIKEPVVVPGVTP